MTEDQGGQQGFSDAFMAPGLGHNARLSRIDAAVDWQPFSGLLRRLRSPLGRRGYDPLVLYKAQLLAQWYQLSDPGLEEALLDRLSFRRFCGLGTMDATPDETTFVRFRAALVRHALGPKLFAELNRQLEQQGLVVKSGTLIDASLVQAAADVRKGEDGGKVTKDPEAGFAQAKGKAFYGYKMHIGVDRDSGLVRRTLLTPANVHESTVADSVICGDEAMVYADKGYDSRARRQALAEAGIADGVMYARRPGPKNPGGAQPRWQVELNKALSPIRAAVEKVFGTLKRSYGYRRVRYLGLERNSSHLYLLMTALNLRRLERLLA